MRSMAGVLIFSGTTHQYNASCFFVVVQNRVVAIWFKGKELAFAFGCFLAVSRLVSSLLLFSSIAAPFKSLDLCPVVHS